MTKEEYKEQLALLKEDYEKKVHSLDLVYAKENNQVRIGNKVRDKIGNYVLVEEMFLYHPYHSETPCVKYIGKKLNKDGTPKRSTAIGCVFQNNLVEIEGKHYKYEE